MKQKITSALSLALILAMLFTSVGLADTISTDVDFVANGNQALVNLGTVTPNQVVNSSTSFQLVCSGKNHADQGNTVLVQYFSATVPAGSLTAANASIGPIPASWADDNGDCTSPAPIWDDNGNSAVTINAPATPGTYDYVVTYKVCQSNDPTQCGGIESNDVSGSISPVTFRLTVSNPVQNQSITVNTPAPASAAYGSQFSVAATGGGSGNAVVIASSGACSGGGNNSAIITMNSGSGTCTVTYNQAGSTGYNAAPQVSSTTTAQKANATINVTGYSVTYDSLSHTASGTAAGANGENLSALLNLSSTTHTNAGTYNGDTWSFAGDANHNTASGSVNDSIGQASATVTLGTLSFTYDGSPKGTTATTAPAGLNVAITYNGSATAPTNAGSYAVLATVNDANYAGSATGTLVIGQATADCSITGFTGDYDDAAHGATGSCTGVGGVDLSAGLSLGASFTDAPGGTAHWAFDGGTNYSNQSGDVAIDISKADAVCSVTGYAGTYDGDAHGASGSCKGAGGVTLSGLNLGDSFTNAPGGSAHWAFSGGTNYNDQSGDAAITLNKANATINVSGYTGVYDGAAHGATGTATGVGDADLSSGLSLGSTFTNVPGGTAHWTFNGGTNYNDDAGDVAIVINKANATINVLGYTGVYDGNAHGATGTATGVGGANLNAGLNLGDSFTDVSGGTAHWTFSGGTNYNDASGDVAITINKADATIHVNGYTGTYDGTAHGATGTATGIGGVDLSAQLDLASTFTDAPGGTAHWTFSGGTNYNDALGDVAITINKANATIHVSGFAGVYDGNAHGATGTATGVEGEALAGLNLGASFTNVPGGTANWNFTDVTGNYNNASGTASISISKANAACTITGYNVLFDNAFHTATGSCTGVNGESLAGLDLSGTSHKLAGIYTDSWTFTDGTGNYNNTSGAVTDKIGSWMFGGFFQPVDMPTPTSVVYNTVKNGSTVPLKFEVFAGTTELTDVNVISATWAAVSCTGGTEDTVEVLATGNTSLRYDTTAGQFIFNWKTPTTANKCYRVTMTTLDGSTLSAYFKLK